LITKKLYFDSETCGLHGMPVLFQWAVEDGPVVLYDVWKHPIGETLDRIEWFLTHTMVFFNASFDMFHLCKCYTLFRLFPRDWIPEEHIDEIAMREPEARDGPCLKPAGVLDLMLHSRRGPFQSLMAREDVRIKRVPTPLADALATELENRVQLDGIYFARSANKDAPRWHVYDCKHKDGEIDPNFKDVVLKFRPAGGLKFLAEYALKRVPKFHFKDVELDSSLRPAELGYAPFALAVTKPDDGWKVHKKPSKKSKKVSAAIYAWPGVIKQHIEHWATNLDAREYAKDDIVYTRDLDAHFKYPQPNDTDSVLACMVAAVRWHGFLIDIDGVKRLLSHAQQIVANAPVNCNKPKDVRRYIVECMDETEKIILQGTTCKAKLEEVGKWEITEEEECFKCDGKGCTRCGGHGKLFPGQHPAARRAREILGIRVAGSEIKLYKKLLRAGRFHASFVVIGTLSSRMAGADGLNPQGIKHTDDVRSLFPLAWDGMVLSIGDFDAFEVSIADAVCDDPALRADLQSGKKIHGIFGSLMYPDMTYDEILATKNQEDDRYTKGKQGFFATILYGGTFETLMRKLGVLEKNARSAISTLLDKYKRVKGWRESVFKRFCSMQQPGGIGSAVYWAEPADYCETFLGFRRYFTLENRICKTVFDLARKPPKEWRECAIRVVRRAREQFACGAVVSALYAAAFGIQAASMRAAANHEIQAVGAEVTKEVQRDVWDLQPAGVHPFKVALMNVHDEIAAVTTPDMVEPVAKRIQSRVESFRSKIPLIAISWNKCVKSWANKK
jgi:hypothetical protein